MTHYDNCLYDYQNGNYRVVILEDGTKIRETEEENFIPAFAENCDVKITDKCDGGCPYCYEGCTKNGKHAKLFDRKIVETLESMSVKYTPAQKWLTKLHPGTELALNGNDLTHPDLNPDYPILLHWLKNRGVVTNLTVNQKHFLQYFDLLKKWSDEKLIHGLGVSMTTSSEYFFEKVKEFPNAVIHTIAGILDDMDICNIGSERNLKVLILGYKTTGRGIEYLETHKHVWDNIQLLRKSLKYLVSNCKVLSFDNLALKQLDVKETLFGGNSIWKWEEFFQGEDGTCTYYIDAVKEQYAKNSCMPDEERFSSKDKTVDEMFIDIRKRYAEDNVNRG